MYKSIFSCPVCGGMLQYDDKTYRCVKNHCFDRAKSGYVNLLTSDRMHSKLPGDNKLMVRARRDFLNKGYYSGLARNLCSLADKYSRKKFRIIDAGCGEGYYTEQIAAALINKEVSAGGIDISKNAVDLAAKSGKNGVEYAAASIFHIPVEENGADLVLSVFSPLCTEEFKRVLKNNGLFFMVIPDRRHLWELKSIIYDKPYENQVKDYRLEGFELIEAIDVPAEMIKLESHEDIENLFTMTPYYYNTKPVDKQKLDNIEALETTIEFKILIYRNKGDN